MSRLKEMRFPIIVSDTFDYMATFSKTLYTVTVYRILYSNQQFTFSKLKIKGVLNQFGLVEWSTMFPGSLSFPPPWSAHKKEPGLVCLMSSKIWAITNKQFEGKMAKCEFCLL